MCFCDAVHVCVRVMRPGWESRGVSVTSSQRFSEVMDSCTDVKALSCPGWTTGEVNITFRHILADMLKVYVCMSCTRSRWRFRRTMH